MFRKIPINTRVTISVMLLCQFVYAEALFDFRVFLKIPQSTCATLSKSDSNIGAFL